MSKIEYDQAFQSILDITVGKLECREQQLLYLKAAGFNIGECEAIRNAISKSWNAKLDNTWKIKFFDKLSRFYALEELDGMWQELTKEYLPSINTLLGSRQGLNIAGFYALEELDGMWQELTKPSINTLLGSRQGLNIAVEVVDL